MPARGPVSDSGRFRVTAGLTIQQMMAVTTASEEMMGEKNRVYGVLCFVSGILFASVVMFCVLIAPEAGAGSELDCMRTHLKATAYRNVIPSQTVDILYDLPSCWAGYGYQMTMAQMYGSNKVWVTYKLPAPSGSLSGNMGAGSQFNPF